jgi:hypothetical protein
MSIPRSRTFALLLVVATLGGCSSLNFIKRRLPPPSQVGDGIAFRFDARSAKIVQVAGSWPENDWLRGQAQTGGFLIGQMADLDRDGIWEITVKITPGRYQYKFLVDQVTWKDDPNNPQRVDDGFGGFNSLLVVR